jgi:hypothetical protein
MSGPMALEGINQESKAAVNSSQMKFEPVALAG